MPVVRLQEPCGERILVVRLEETCGERILVVRLEEPCGKVRDACGKVTGALW